MAFYPEPVARLIDALQRLPGIGPKTAQRLTFFLHRHWAVSNGDGIDLKFMRHYRDRLRHYGDLAANPTSSFRDLAVEMTTGIAAMNEFLTR